MKMPKISERFRLYVRIGAIFAALSLLGDLLDDPPTFPKRIANNLWLTGYLVGINFLLFERTVPFLYVS